MTRRLLTPGWIAGTVMVIAIATVFVLLGLWQLDRLSERQASNEASQKRYNLSEVDLTTGLTDRPGDVEHRRAFVAGEYDVENEVLIRSQVYRGQAGFHVITPMVRSDGSAILVNRGWVPLTLDTVPVSEAAPSIAEDRTDGWIHLNQERPFLGPQDPPDGVLIHLSRVDIDRIQQQVPYPLDPVYLVRIRENGTLPEPVAEPDFTDEGPHFVYAMQWFGFAVVLMVGYAFLVRRRLSSGSR